MESDSRGLTRPLQPMPEFVRTAIKENGVMKAYELRPPYQRNDYLWWINTAKKTETKEKRLRQMIDELKSGNRYMNMPWRGETR